jgi:hypothetical protein
MLLIKLSRLYFSYAVTAIGFDSMWTKVSHREHIRVEHLYYAVFMFDWIHLRVVNVLQILRLTIPLRVEVDRKRRVENWRQIDLFYGRGSSR